MPVDLQKMYPNHNTEHLERRSEWFKVFFGFYPWDIPEGFKMPGGVWSDPKPMIEAGHNYINFGQVGSGKSTAIAWACWKLILDMPKVSIRGGSVTDILHRLKSKEVEDYRKTFEEADVLVLDDLDKQLGSTYETVELFALADGFFKRGKSVMVSMNPSPQDFCVQLKSSKYNIPDVWADSFLSRICNKADIVHMKSVPDFRKVNDIKSV